MAVTMTESARAHVRRYLESRGHGLGVRLGVKTTGCSGLSYVLEFIDALQDGDEVFDSSDVKIIVDAKSLVYIDGTELDYVREGLNEGFEFKNPNVTAECGCGESFHV
jgi:iron-sulfur cluster assembly protein